ncbi:MAG: glycerophosphodiester phosphodiesterase [Actinomycetota bacterium]
MLIIAHRGSSATHRENSLPAFTAAVSAGADGVELDVRRTADDRLVVHHDPVLAGGTEIVRCQADDLPSEVPALHEALAACAPCVVNVEIKDLPGEVAFDPERTTARLVTAALSRPPVPVLVSSFDPGALGVVRGLDPELGLGLLAVSAEGLVERAVALGARAIHPGDRSVDAALVERAHAAGLQVNVWTVNDPERLRELRAMGVDAAISDDPAAARAALAG